MVESKAWNWKDADKSRWMRPSEDAVYLAHKWKEEGVHSILDLGCGLGRHSLYFAKNGFKVTAMDLSVDAIAEAKKLREKSGIDYLCRVSDMVNMPFSTDAFDAVFSYHVISHQDTEGVKKVIKEISRVLKPNGKVFLTLCSKTHEAFLNDNYPKLDENTVLKTEGAEVDVPHFFADKKIIKEFFTDYELISVRHITECEFDSDKMERSHYFIEAVIKKESYRPDYSGIIGRKVSCTMDRPMGTEHKGIIYPINYGYVNGTIGGDGAEQDVYVLGADCPLEGFDGVVIAVYHRFNDNEDKWITAPSNSYFTNQEILDKIDFMEQFFDGELVR